MNIAKLVREQPFDVIVVGSGAGGSAAASRLAAAGLEILIVEKGDHLITDGRTLDVDRVVANGEFKSHEPWVDVAGGSVTPEEYFNIGGKTKWYGAALLRFAPEEFAADRAHQCPAWPIAYTDIAPYYQELESTLGIRTFEPEPDLTRMITALRRRGDRWNAEPLNMGLRPEILNNTREASHFDGFASPTGMKADAEGVFLADLAGRANVRIIKGCPVVALVGEPSRPTTLAGVRLGDGRIARAKAVILAAGALHSPRLLQQYLKSEGLGRLPVAANVGRNLKLHVLTAVLAVAGRPQHDLLRKTMLLLNADLAHSSVQPLGFDAGLLTNLIPRYVPRPIARAIGTRSYGFFLQTEDGSSTENRVVDAGCPGNPSGAYPLIDYDASRVMPARDEHSLLVRRFRRGLLGAGYPNFAMAIGVHGTAHACGTLMAGVDPQHSVVDASGKVHGFDGLYVADGSVLPRVSRVNPALTIYAWGLRTADLLVTGLKRTVDRTAALAESRP